jgi:hypothetical protein
MKLSLFQTALSVPAFVTAALLLSATAAAQSGTAAAAEALFQDGRALLEQGRFEEACPKLAQSQSIDPGTGTLLALALCHEGQKKLASAWQEFTEVERQARRAGRTDRETIAREHVAALRPRLSTLTLDVPEEVAATPGLEVKVDGVVTETNLFGVPVPMDGGEHRIEVSAPGRKAWSETVQIKPESHSASVTVPPLAPAEEAAPAPTSEPSGSTPSDEQKTGRRSGSPLKTAGLITAGAGVVLLGVGSYLALDAKADYDAASELCSGDQCPSDQYEITEDARSQGTVATVLFVAGGAALATGAVLWVIAPSSQRGSAKQEGLRLKSVGVEPRGIVLRGSF